MQLSWEGKWCRQGCFSYSGALVLKEKEYWSSEKYLEALRGRGEGEREKQGLLLGVGRMRAPLDLVLVDLSTRWHPYVFSFALVSVLRKNLFKSSQNKCNLDLGFIIYEADFMSYPESCVTVFQTELFYYGIIIISVGVPLPPPFLQALLLPLRLDSLPQASGKQPGVQQ